MVVVVVVKKVMLGLLVAVVVVVTVTQDIKLGFFGGRGARRGEEGAGGCRARAARSHGRPGECSRCA